ncbi:unnamed protein product [Urochloa humidicola]
MSGTATSGDTSAMGALTSSSTAALISAAANAAASAAAASNSVSASTQGVNIKALIPITLDMQTNCYRRWKTLFHIVLGRFDLLSHIDTDARRPNDPAWVQADLTVVMWLHATLDDNLMDMVMVDDPTARRVRNTITTYFNNNKASRAIDLEAELHSIQQGDLSVSEYCHKIQHLAHCLADCDQPVSDRVLVHQLIRGLDARFSTLKTLLPALPTFPTFPAAREHLFREERALLQKSQPSSTESALVATDGTASTSDAGGGARADNGGRGTNYNNYRGGRTSGRGGGRYGRGRGRGGGGGRGNSNNAGRGQQQQPQPQQQAVPAWIPYYPQWGGMAWRAPWAGTTGPGVLGARPPAPAGQAYPAFTSPPTQSAPSSYSWDTSSLIAALHAASQQQPNNGE